MPQHEVILYTRVGCHLCDVSRETLVAHGLTPLDVDIDADPELRAKYDWKVPVISIDGRERFFGRVDPVLLKRLLQGESL